MDLEVGFVVLCGEVDGGRVVEWWALVGYQCGVGYVVEVECGFVDGEDVQVDQVGCDQCVFGVDYGVVGLGCYIVDGLDYVVGVVDCVWYWCGVFGLNDQVVDEDEWGGEVYDQFFILCVCWVSIFRQVMWMVMFILICLVISEWFNRLVMLLLILMLWFIGLGCMIIVVGFVLVS